MGKGGWGGDGGIHRHTHVYKNNTHRYIYTSSRNNVHLVKIRLCETIEVMTR